MTSWTDIEIASDGASPAEVVLASRSDDGAPPNKLPGLPALTTPSPASAKEVL